MEFLAVEAKEAKEDEAIGEIPAKTGRAPKQEAHPNPLAQQSDDKDQHLLMLLAVDVDHHYEELVRAYAERIYTFLRRLTTRPEYIAEIEDIVQQTFLHAYQALRNYDERRIRALRLPNWLYTIARHDFYKHLRSNKLQMESMGVSEEALWELEDPFDLPDLLLETTEQVEEVKMCINSLPQQYRTALLLRFFDELSYAEIAMIRSESISKVKSDMHRGKKMLRRVLLQRAPELLI